MLKACGTSDPNEEVGLFDGVERVPLGASLPTVIAPSLWLPEGSLPGQDGSDVVELQAMPKFIHKRNPPAVLQMSWPGAARQLEIT